MKKVSVIVLLLANILLATFACVKESSNPDWVAEADCSGIDAANNTYSKSIKAILDVQCATSGCHDAITSESGVNLSSYAGAKTGFESQNCLCTMHQGNGCNPMPKGGVKLNNATLQKIDCWVKNGYLQ